MDKSRNSRLRQTWLQVQALPRRQLCPLVSGLSSCLGLLTFKMKTMVELFARGPGRVKRPSEGKAQGRAQRALGESSVSISVVVRSH